MNNLGGHDIPSILEAFEAVDHDRPVCFLCYTVKGFGLPLAGHKDNHAGLMNEAQMEGLRASMNIRTGCEWEPFEGLGMPAGRACSQFLSSVPFAQAAERRLNAPHIEIPEALPVPQQKSISTQAAFGNILNDIGREQTLLAAHIVTTSPDVTVSTNLGAWVNRRGIFGRDAMPDLFREQRIASAQRWEFSATGQHMELGIAEMNLFLLLGAMGLSHSLFGARLLPIGTLYDPFIARGLDALNYACYQDCAIHPGRDAERRGAGAGRRCASVDRNAADRHGAAGSYFLSSRPMPTSCRSSCAGRSSTSSSTETRVARSICGSRRVRSISLAGA